MFRNPDEIASKPISQHILERLMLDLMSAPAHRLLTLLQTQPTIQGKTPTHEGEKVSHQGLRYFAHQIYQQEGILGFWKGCIFDIIKNGTFRIFHSFFLRLYEPLFNVEDRSKGDLKTVSIEFLLFCAIETSLHAIQHPFRVIRVRLAALETPMDPEAPRGFRKISHCVRRIWNEDGFKGFYRGFGMALLESVTVALYVSAQRMIAHYYVGKYSENTPFWDRMKESVNELSGGSVLSAALTVTSTGQKVLRRFRTVVFQFGRYLGNLVILYPLRVLQKRIIMHESQWKIQRTSARSLTKEIWKKEGIRGFYSGLSTQILLDMGVSTLSPLITEFSGAILPEAIKAVPKVGDINASIEPKMNEITGAAAEEVTHVAQEVEEKWVKGEKNIVEKIKELTKTPSKPEK